MTCGILDNRAGGGHETLPLVYPAGSTLYPAQGPRFKPCQTLKQGQLSMTIERHTTSNNTVRSFVRITFRGLNDLSLLIRNLRQAWTVDNPSLVQLAKDKSGIDRQYNQNCLKWLASGRHEIPIDLYC
jgi:hypothetical protein